MKFVSFDVELEGVKSEIELVALECEMLGEAIKAILASMGPELLAHYPKATQPGPGKMLAFREAQGLLGLSGEEALSAEEERGLGGADDGAGPRAGRADPSAVAASAVLP